MYLNCNEGRIYGTDIIIYSIIAFLKIKVCKLLRIVKEGGVHVCIGVEH